MRRTWSGSWPTRTSRWWGPRRKWAAAEGRIVRHDGNQVWVEAIRELDGTVRENLRMPVRFESFLYPVSGSWKGRRPIVSRDLSCGGVAFYCKQRLEEGEIAQIVVPVTSQPLLLDLKILRQRPSPEPVPLYAAEFTVCSGRRRVWCGRPCSTSSCAILRSRDGIPCPREITEERKGSEGHEGESSAHGRPSAAVGHAGGHAAPDGLGRRGQITHSPI